MAGRTEMFEVEVIAIDQNKKIVLDIFRKDYYNDIVCLLWSPENGHEAVSGDFFILG